MQSTSPASAAEAIELDTPLTVAALVAAETIDSPRQVYEAIYAGAEHFRRGRAIRMTRRQWRAWWGAGHVPAGTYAKDPIRSQRALHRSAKAAQP